MADELFTALEKVKESRKSVSDKLKDAVTVVDEKGYVLTSEGQAKLKGFFTTASDHLFEPREGGIEGISDADIEAVAFRNAFGMLRNPPLAAPKPGGGKLGNKFNRCVKAVRKTVKARKGSNKESAAIAICTKTVLHRRGKTLKRYRKGRLVTQKKFRGGGSWCS